MSSKILDKIKTDFKYVNYGVPTFTIGSENDDIMYNNFELTVSYNGKSVKAPLSIGNINLTGLDDSGIQKTFKMDIIEKIIIDYYPFENVDEVEKCLLEKGYVQSEEFDEMCNQIFENVKAQAEKWRTLFTESELKQLEDELDDFTNACTFYS